jgi:hypothetical protein
MPIDFALVRLSTISNSRLIKNSSNRIDAIVIYLLKSLYITIAQPTRF